MKIVYEKQFVDTFDDIIAYINQDSPQAAINFAKNLKQKFELLQDNPKMYQKSKYFDIDCYRDMTFMGYTIIYKIADETISVLDIFKWIEKDRNIYE